MLPQVLDEHCDVGNVDIREPVIVEVRYTHIHGVQGLGNAERRGDVLESSVAEISQQSIPPEVIGNDNILPPIPIEIGMGDGLGPASIARPAPFGDVDESHTTDVSEQLVRESILVVPLFREHVGAASKIVG